MPPCPALHFGHRMRSMTVQAKLWLSSWLLSSFVSLTFSVCCVVGWHRYLKALDPQIHTSGPCLSNASYRSITRDESIQSTVTISGGRTDDLVRVFIHVQYAVQKDVDFSRLVFFQAGSETYNYHSDFDAFVMGSGDPGKLHYLCLPLKLSLCAFDICEFRICGFSICTFGFCAFGMCASASLAGAKAMRQ